MATLKTFSAKFDEITCYVDSRLQIDFELFKNIKFIKIDPSLIDRLGAEVQYKKFADKFDTFYFLGNLPPLFRLKANVILFVQNRLLISPFLPALFPLKAFLRKWFEILWFNFFMKNVNQVEVQTVTMKKDFSKRFPFKIVTIENYLDLDELKSYRNKFIEQNLIKEKNTFVTICSIEQHKNIKRLILAFAKIPSVSYQLLINLEENSSLYQMAKDLKLSIRLITSSDRESILKAIYTSEFLIHPSLIESLGLPLIEAQEMGTKIIASNLSYVFDVCNPIRTFNPESIDSIAEAINSSIHLREV